MSLNSDPALVAEYSAKDLDYLAASIVPAPPAEASEAQTAAYQAALENVKNLALKIFSYMVSNMEVKNVAVTTGTLHGATTPSVAAGDGGTVLYSNQLKIDINSRTLSQNNNGTGLIL